MFNVKRKQTKPACVAKSIGAGLAVTGAYVASSSSKAAGATPSCPRMGYKIVYS